MLLANQTIAEHINTKLKTNEQVKPFVYRVHDTPVIEKIETLSRFVKRFGLELNTANSAAISRSMNKLLTASKGNPWQNVVETIAIRSMAKAEYSADNIGHYGLAFKYYTHFTSPIRRYPDIMVHRLLTQYAEGEKPLSKSNLEAICQHCNERESSAVSAERSSIKYKQVEYLQNHINEEFDGVISGVTNWGLYVELLDNSCEGMVPAHSLDDDYYIFDEEQYQLIGKIYRKRYQLGDKVRIRIVKADLVKKLLDFEIIKSYAPHGTSKRGDNNTTNNLSRGYSKKKNKAKKKRYYDK
jgi:ribonuclease R